MHNNKKR